ncbi:sensor domain-containing diguanylate cyclase [Caenispirillum bisanense]|uniref:sensor domain-containing diguanylate cyclase n=1 Tax=Caenispirillum bisanense TaxID=414052 RepID=UPI0031D716B3
MAAPLPADEDLRLLVLQECNILDTPPDPVFDSIVDLAAQMCGTPIALISLIDADRQWFKARRGLSISETPREHAFCAHAILATEPFEVPDATADPRFADNPAVVGEPFVRFYAGFPITAGDGRPLGTLCVVGSEPQQLDEAQRAGMQRLADLVSALLAERHAASVARRAAEAQAEQLRRLAVTDTVTGAFNRRGFLDQCTWCGSAGGVLVLVEVDSLTAIRDQLGLTAAEAVVRSVTGLAARVVTTGDVVGRLTASTGALFLPGRDLAAGRATAERLRQLVRAAPVDTPTGRYVPTITAGVAAVKPGSSVEPAIAAAMAALGEARALGGDAVVVCAHSTLPPRPPTVL